MEKSIRWKILRSPGLYISLVFVLIIFTWVYFGWDTTVLNSLLTSWPMVVVIAMILFQEQIREVIGRIKFKIGKYELDVTGISDRERDRLQEVVVKNFGREYIEQLDYMHIHSDITVELDEQGGASVVKKETVRAVRERVSPFEAFFGADSDVDESEIKDLEFEIGDGPYRPTFEDPITLQTDKKEGRIKAFPVSIETDKAFTVITKAYYVKSFMGATEEFEDQVIWPTEKLTIKVFFPENCIPEEVSAYSDWLDIGPTKKSEPLPLTETKMKGKKKYYARKDWVDPIIGGFFRIRWTWKPPSQKGGG